LTEKVAYVDADFLRDFLRLDFLHLVQHMLELLVVAFVPVANFARF